MYIAPKPTEYDGTLYRSRLEAHWAVFFTLAKFPFAYEPKGEGTTPDFRIVTPQHIVSLEVKPAMVKKPEWLSLRREGVNFLGIGGFWKEKYPTLVHIKDKALHRRDFDVIFGNKGFKKAFYHACHTRFDLA